MKQTFFTFLFSVICFVSIAQNTKNKTLTHNDPLLILLGRGSQRTFSNVDSEISNHYLGEYTIVNYWEFLNSRKKYDMFRFEMSINVFKSNLPKGKYKGIYTLHDRSNKSKMKWVFYSDDKLPNMTALFASLNKMALNPELGYRDVFPDDCTYKLNLSPEIVLDTNSLKASSIEECQTATFLIKSDIGQGSGFFIDSRYAVTNYHVVGDNKSITGTDQVGLEFRLKVVHKDSDTDLALLKAINGYSSDFHFYIGNLVDSSIVGKDVFAIGSPASEELINTVSGGIVSGVRSFDDLEVIQINAPVNPGNSGGPLVNNKGELIGIVVAKIAGLGTEGIGFVIPKDQLFECFNLLPQF